MFVWIYQDRQYVNCLDDNYIKNNEKSPQFIDHINSLGISCFFILEDDKMYINSIYTFDMFDNSIVNKPIRYKKDIVMQYGYKNLVLIQ